MNHAALRQAVYEANMALVEQGLVKLTWGNASGIDRKRGIVAIKPSGVEYATLKPDDIVLVDLASGDVVEGRRPSSDTPTHLALYRAFEGIGGVVHTHSARATAFAQAGAEIPCLGTTHADNFYGPVPVTPPLTDAEIEGSYEANTGDVIIRLFRERRLDPLQMPAVLVAGHAPFTWGSTPAKAAENAVVLEFVAGMALDTFRLKESCPPIGTTLLDRHFLRKHGPNAYYGQGEK